MIHYRLRYRSARMGEWVGQNTNPDMLFMMELANEMYTQVGGDVAIEIEPIEVGDNVTQLKPRKKNK